MVKKIFNSFVCDKCGKESEHIEEKKWGYPYSENWVYLYNLKYKLRKDKEFSLNDKHFCSKECIIQYFIGKLEEIK